MTTNPEHQRCGDCTNTAENNPQGCMSRRQFLKLMLGLCAVSWGAMTTFPIFQYLTPPKEQNQGPDVTSVSLGKVDGLAKGSGKNFQFGHTPALIIRDEAGELHAFNAICSHLGCTVQYDPSKSNIFCACHGGQYDAATGKNIAGPPPKPLKTLDANIVNGEIIVSKPGVSPSKTEPAPAEEAKAS